jgi:hypothetical protein
MYSLAQPGFLALGALLLLPGLLRYRRVWQYSNTRLLRYAGQRDILSICLSAVTWLALSLLVDWLGQAVARRGTCSRTPQSQGCTLNARFITKHGGVFRLGGSRRATNQVGTHSRCRGIRLKRDSCQTAVVT